MRDFLEHIRFSITVLKAYPRQSVPVIFFQFVAALLEGIGLVAMLPLLAIVLEEKATNAPAGQVEEIFRSAGFEPTLELLLLIIVTLICLKAGAIWFAKSQVGYATARIGTDLRRDLISAIADAKWPYYISKSPGVLANALTIETENASNAFLHSARFGADIPLIGVYFALTITTAWHVSLTAVTVGFVIALILHRYVQISRQTGQDQLRLLRSTSSQLVDRLGGFKALKAMAEERVLSTTLTSDAAAMEQVKRREVFAKEGLSALQEPAFVLALLLGFYGAVEFLSLESSTLLVLLVVLFRAMGRIGSLQKTLQGIVRCEASYCAIERAIAEARSEAEVTTGDRQPKFKNTIEFREVRFGYTDADVIDRPVFKIEAGSFTALFGPSGAGKTTIIDLVAGLLRPREGDVWIDDTPLAEIDLKKWREMIGYMPQEPVLFNDTLRANIALDQESYTDADIEEALRNAGLWDYVASLPDGLDTPVGEKGLRFSGGQRQRIALARALVRKPRLLILDEATSSLDPRSEAAVLKTVSSLKGWTTILAISHQPAIRKSADVVYRIADGQLHVDEGVAA